MANQPGLSGSSGSRQRWRWLWLGVAAIVILLFLTFIAFWRLCCKPPHGGSVKFGPAESRFQAL